MQSPRSNRQEIVFKRGISEERFDHLGYVGNFSCGLRAETYRHPPYHGRKGSPGGRGLFRTVAIESCTISFKLHAVFQSGAADHSGGPAGDTAVRAIAACLRMDPLRDDN